MQEVLLMTNEVMAERLGIGQAELEVLKAQEQAKSLPERYTELGDYLEAQIDSGQRKEWAALVGGIRAARGKTASIEEMDVLIEKVRAFLETL